MENVSWYDAIAYCNQLSIKTGHTPCYRYKGKGTNPEDWPAGWKEDTHNHISCDFAANGYRLPTEAEWEYAARGGRNAMNTLYAGGSDIDEVAWHKSNSDGHPHEVGSKASNELQLFDMSGNVWEWCWDWYDNGDNHRNQANNPRGPENGSERVLRGGSWYFKPEACRIATRYKDFPGNRYNYANYGFRLARSL